ncbi:phosphotransferase [Pedobacter cryoconitis]|uniref:Aminoglycoside phosphotransferase domain-containing protein n=1 Tax=Pedobacter cryoconitis TaxID=188932 RepID=A0A7X0J0H0_9SPHI|nr:phosphotransferase [Pedobacter cryoconitis]MBB6498816.1 hypothetical protein [Pedobacter cryoconitis]
MIQSLIPEEKLTLVEQALLQAFNTATVSDIIQLTGGLSSSLVYKIIVNDRPYVLKLDKEINPYSAMEPTCAELAARAGVSPPIYYLNHAEGISVTGFVNPIPLRTAYTSSDLLIKELAGTIRAIHAIPLFTKENNLLETVDGLIGGFKISKMLSGPVFDECDHYYGIIRKHYPWHDEDKVSSHNDLNPNNMVCDGQKIWVIDWDAAFKNDRYVDLAIAANFFVHTAEQEEQLLQGYFGDSLSEYNSSRFFIMRQITNIVYAMLMFKLADSSKVPGTAHDPEMQHVNLKEVMEGLGTGKLDLGSYQGQLLYGKAIFNEGLKNMRSPRFTLSIDSLAAGLLK